jgi:hypothetical protein
MGLVLGQVSTLHDRLLRLRLEVRTRASEVEISVDETPQPRGGVESKALANAAENLWRMLDALSGKANFNPNQPRVPAGNPDGGRWTGDPKWGGSGKPSKPRTRSRSSHIGDPKGPEPTAKPPAVPSAKPPTVQEQNARVKRWGHWLAQSAVRGQSKKVRIALEIAQEAAPWIYEHWPEIRTLFDEPRSLAELQRAASEPGPGYEIHHVVEQKAARRAGYSEEMIESQVNRVRIPKYRHEQITGYYNGYDRDLGMSPREYLRERTWQEQYEFGLEVLKDYGVLLR